MDDETTTTVTAEVARAVADLLTTEERADLEDETTALLDRACEDLGEIVGRFSAWAVRQDRAGGAEAAALLHRLASTLDGALTAVQETKTTTEEIVRVWR